MGVDTTDEVLTAHVPFISCLVASTPRTGSTLLCKGLSRTGLAGQPEEYFRTDGGPSWRKRWGMSTDVWYTYEEYVHTAVSRTTASNGVFSAKLHWHQFAWLMRAVQSGHEPAGALPDTATMEALFPNPRYVHLRRLDKAAQALSYYRAVYSGVWSVPADHPNPRRGRVPARADLRQVRWFEDLIEAQDRRWTEWFDRNGVEPLEITYEELDATYGRTIGRVLDLLGLGRPVGGISPIRDLRRQAGTWSADWAAQYADQRDALTPQPAGEAWADVDRLDRPARPARVTRIEPRTAFDAVTGRLRPAPRIVYSCVSDRAPLYKYQSLVWALTLLRLAGRSPDDLVVHALRGTSKDHLRRVRSLGVQVEIVDRFHKRNAFANKLRQLASPALADADWVVLCDCDLAFRADVSPYVIESTIGAKVVDGGKPPYATWVRLARQAGLEGDLLATRATNTLRWTWVNNLNGGFLIVPQDFMAPLAEAWPRWLNWIFEHHATVPQRAGVIYHAFQVSFGLAVLELGLPVRHLPPSLNFTIAPPHSNEGIDPVVVHFHKRLTSSGLLRPTKVPLTDAAVESVNALLRSAESQELLQTSLREWQESVGAG